MSALPVTVRAGRVFIDGMFCPIPQAAEALTFAQREFNHATVPSELERWNALASDLTRAIREAQSWAEQYLERHLK